MKILKKAILLLLVGVGIAVTHSMQLVRVLITGKVLLVDSVRLVKRPEARIVSTRDDPTSARAALRWPSRPFPQSPSSTTNWASLCSEGHTLYRVSSLCVMHRVPFRCSSNFPHLCRVQSRETITHTPVCAPPARCFAHEGGIINAEA